MRVLAMISDRGILLCCSQVLWFGELFLISIESELAAFLYQEQGTRRKSCASFMYSSPPRPLPYDVDPRCFQLQQAGIVSSCEKGSSHSHEESESLGRGDNGAGRKSLSTGGKYSGFDEGGSKKYFSNPPAKHFCKAGKWDRVFLFIIRRGRRLSNMSRSSGSGEDKEIKSEAG